MSNLDPETLRHVYSEVCKSYHAIADFRAKLLGLLPLASGTGILLLLQRSDIDCKRLGVIGIFGFLVTLGLFLHELRGIQRCKALIETGKKLESELLNLDKEVQGPFLSRPEDEFKFIGSTGAAWYHRHMTTATAQAAPNIAFTT